MRDPNKLIDLAQELGKPMEFYLKYRQVVGRYERGKSERIARIIKDLKREEKESMSSLENRAHASDEWKQYLKEWDEAEKKMVSWQVKYDTAKVNYEAYQSALSYDKALVSRGI
jgi:thiamine kinase-like enzyme